MIAKTMPTPVGQSSPALAAVAALPRLKRERERDLAQTGRAVGRPAPRGCCDGRT